MKYLETEKWMEYLAIEEQMDFLNCVCDGCVVGFICMGLGIDTRVACVCFFVFFLSIFLASGGGLPLCPEILQNTQ